MPTISANGINFNYQIDGPDGAPWLTFSNSLATNLTMWDEQAVIYSEDWRVLRYDQRGHGSTEATPPPYSFDILVQDVIALWDAIGVKRSVFCGLSMGGTTGLGLAIDHGKRLTAFIGCDLPHHSPPEFVQAWNDRKAIAQKEGMAGMAAPTVNRWCTNNFVNNPENKNNVDKLLNMINSTKLDGFLGCAGAIQTINYQERIGQINVPTLFMAGAEDSAAGPKLMEPLLKLLPNTEMHIVPNAGHIVNMENSENFNQTLKKFLNSL